MSLGPQLACSEMWMKWGYLTSDELWGLYSITITLTASSHCLAHHSYSYCKFHRNSLVYTYHLGNVSFLYMLVLHKPFTCVRPHLCVHIHKYIHTCMHVYTCTYTLKAQTNIRIFGLLFVLTLFEFNNSQPIIRLLFKVTVFGNFGFKVIAHCVKFQVIINT